MTTSSTSARTPPQPKTSCDYFDRSRINPYLKDLHDELRDDYPELHTFMTENVVVHMGSGKKIVASAEDLTVATSPSTAPQGLATPRRRTRAATTEPPATLTREQEKSYYLAPPIIVKIDKDLAAFISRSMTTAAAKQELRRLCGDSGRAMLLHLEERGKGATGSPQQIQAADQLVAYQRAGPAAPTPLAWLSYSQQLTALSRTAGDDPATLVGRLRLSLFHLPSATRLGAQTAAASATTPDGVTAAVSAFLEEESVGRSLTASAPPAAPAPPAPAVPVNQRDPWLFPASEYPAGHPSGPPALSRAEVTASLPSAAAPIGPDDAAANPHAALAAGFDPRKHASMPKPPWSARDHPPCFNWVRARDGCDGRHHLRDCPLPRPSLAVEVALADELPQPMPALTAAQDFARLYEGGQQLDFDFSSGSRPVLSAAVVKQDDICTACDYDSYDTASEGGDYDDYVLASEGDEMA